MTANSQPRILCISPFFPPFANAESFCAAKQVKALVDAGFDVSVLHCSNINGPNYQHDDSEMWAATSALATDVLIPREKNYLLTALKGFRYGTPFYVRWIHLAAEVAIRMHAQRKFDVVYSRSLPTVAHVAGFWCAKLLGLPWIVSMNDPWDVFLVPGRDAELPWLDFTVSNHWFKKTMSSADVMIYPTERLWRYHNRILGVDRPAVIVPHIGGCRPAPPTHGPATFRIVHAGKLGRNEKPHRPIDALLMGLRDFLADHPEAKPITSLVLVGPEDESTLREIASLGVAEYVKVLGQVNYVESLRHINSASVCLLVEAELEEGIFLPSKLADYISAGKPVVAFSPEVGVVADMAADRAIVRVDSNRPAAVRDLLGTLFEEHKSGKLGARVPGRALASQFTSEVVVERFRSISHQLGFDSAPRQGRVPMRATS